MVQVKVSEIFNVKASFSEENTQGNVTVTGWKA